MGLSGGSVRHYQHVSDRKMTPPFICTLVEGCGVSVTCLDLCFVLRLDLTLEGQGSRGHWRQVRGLGHASRRDDTVNNYIKLCNWRQLGCKDVHVGVVCCDTHTSEDTTPHAAS